MKKIFLNTLFFLASVNGFCQSNQLWKGYFSYNIIKDLSEGNTHIFGAAENAYFKNNLVTNEKQNTTTIDGLSGDNINQIYHSKKFNKTIIGYEGGLMAIVNEYDGSFLNVIDIVNKPSIPQNMKNINHFMEYNDNIYIATGYGISVFNLKLQEFGDTYFIGAGGSNIEVLQTTVHNGFIYAVAKGYGLMKASITNPNLVDFNQWTNAVSGNWLNIQATSNELIAINSVASLYKITNDVPSLITTLSSVPVDTRYNDGNLVITTNNRVYFYNEQLTETLQISSIPNVSTPFTCATIINQKIYIGTNSEGVFETTLNNPANFTKVSPEGPDKNRIFGVRALTNGFWAVFGDYDIGYNPYGLDFYSINKYTNENGWKSIPYSNLLDAKSIVQIAIHPKNENLAYFSSFYSGLLELQNDVPKTIYNLSNSSLNEIIIPSLPTYRNDIRINEAVFDKNGNLWMTNSLVNQSLHVLKSDGTWKGYAFSCSNIPTNNSFGKLAIDKNGTKWACSTSDGLIGFNESLNNKCLTIKEGEGNGNLPSNAVRAVAVDNKNKLWIGTNRGLRILQNVDSFISQNKLTTNSIIILEDGLAQELLFGQTINDIVVDGANNKWIGTLGAGVFYLSSDGQQTFNIFTKENSPLPSNDILDIDINKTTGEVYIATEKGMVSFKGNATAGADNFENVTVYPNPVRPNYQGNLYVTGLIDKTNVKITDIEGNLVHEEIAEGGTISWDTKSFGKQEVASGVYMVLLSSENGEQTKVKKIMIIR